MKEPTLDSALHYSLDHMLILKSKAEFHIMLVVSTRLCLGENPSLNHNISRKQFLLGVIFCNLFITIWDKKIFSALEDTVHAFKSRNYLLAKEKYRSALHNWPWQPGYTFTQHINRLAPVINHKAHKVKHVALSKKTAVKATQGLTDCKSV